ncbi:MAG: tetratricopeptide repeat protein [Rhodothermales bacterium]|nr:tetratricopeptide repeat protein [Rhodothermales bacterium]
MTNRWKQSPFLLAYVLAGFVLFAVFWFGAKRATDPHAEAGWTAAPAAASASTTPSETFTPDKSNVNPTTHSQLETLRMRLVEAPDDTTHLIRFGRLLQDAHQPEEAARTYRHYLALHPANRQVWLDLTQCYGELQQWDEALKAVDDLLARYSGDPAGRYNKGAILANMSRFQDARAIWTEVADQIDDPDVALMARQSLNKLPPG